MTNEQSLFAANFDSNQVVTFVMTSGHGKSVAWYTRLNTPLQKVFGLLLQQLSMRVLALSGRGALGWSHADLSSWTQSPRAHHSSDFIWTHPTLWPTQPPGPWAEDGCDCSTAHVALVGTAPLQIVTSPTTLTFLGKSKVEHCTQQRENNTTAQQLSCCLPFWVTFPGKGNLPLPEVTYLLPG